MNPELLLFGRDSGSAGEAAGVIYKRRLLPVEGEVLVRAGDRVRAADAVAQAALPGKFHLLPAAARLGVAPGEIRKFLRKNTGEEVREGEVLAAKGAWIAWLKAEVASPAAGVVESVSELTGKILIREAPQVLRLSAHVGGVVTEVIEGWGAVVETFGARIQGAYGVGGETHGPLHITDALTPEDRGKILVVDAPAGAALLQRAAAAGVAGLILGGLPDADLAAFLGEELDPSVSGAQASAMTIVLTEGFGRLAIAGPTLRLLKNFEGAEASLSGHTHIRAGTVRPEIILARTPSRLPAAAAAAPEPAPPVGRRIRILRGPEAWKIARVAAAPKAPQTIDTESPVRVFDALLEDGRICRVPRANVEFLEAPAKISKI